MVKYQTGRLRIIAQYFCTVAACGCLLSFMACCVCHAQEEPAVFYYEKIPRIQLEENESLVEWNVDLGGQCSDIFVTDNHVIYFGHASLPGTGQNDERRDAITVGGIDRTSGNILWKYNSLRNKNWQTDLPETALRTYPAMTDDRMVFLSNDSKLVCLDLAGLSDGDDGQTENGAETLHENVDIVWQIDLTKQFNTSRSELTDTACRVGGVVIDQQTCFVVTGHGRHFDAVEDAAAFVAVDLNTGKIKWSKTIPGLPQRSGHYAAPVILARTGKNSLVIFPGADGILYAYDSSSMQLVWEIDCQTSEPKDAGDREPADHHFFFAPPLIVGNKIVVYRNRSLENIVADGQVMCFEIKDNGNPTLKWKWNSPEFTGSFSPLQLHGETAIVKDISGALMAIDIESGQRKWQWKARGIESVSLFASPSFTKHRVVIATDWGVRIGRLPDDSIGPCRVTLQGLPVLSQPKIDGDQMFGVFGQQLYNISLSKLNAEFKEYEDPFFLGTIVDEAIVADIMKVLDEAGVKYQMAGSRGRAYLNVSQKDKTKALEVLKPFENAIQRFLYKSEVEFDK